MKQEYIDKCKALLNYSDNENGIQLIETLQRGYLENYSFNSITVLLGKSSLTFTDDELFEKIVEKGLGGYCFEHNKLFFSFLESLGFTTEIIIAKVLYNEDITHQRGRTHRLSLVTIDSIDYLVDVGFGPDNPQQPIPLTGEEIDTGMGRIYRVHKVDTQHYALQILKDKSFFTLYQFDKATYTEGDCDMGHFFSHQYPKASFVNNLVVSRILSDTVYLIRNHQFYTLTENGTEEEEITSTSRLDEILRNVFSLSHTEDELNTLYTVIDKKRE